MTSMQFQRRQTYLTSVKLHEDLNKFGQPHIGLLLQEQNPGGVLFEGRRQAEDGEHNAPNELLGQCKHFTYNLESNRFLNSYVGFSTQHLFV